MKKSEELNKELSEWSPLLLERRGKDEGFKVPEHYFSQLPGEVLAKIMQQQTKSEPARSSWFTERVVLLWQPRLAVALAAAITLLLACILLLQPPKKPDMSSPPAVVTLDDVSDEILHAYLLENVRDIDRDLIMEIHFAGQESLPPEKTTPKPQDDELEKYLENHLDDIDLDDLL